MISTVTLNPSIDYIMQVNDFQIGEVNRTAKETMFPGGKGINVSIILKNLEVDNRALGFVAGFTGEEISMLVEKTGVESHFIHLKQGVSRVNVKLKSNEETEINGNGPEISSSELKQLVTQITDIGEEDWLVLAGSIPSSVPDDIYEQMMSQFRDKQTKIVVDATKDLLLKVLPHKPFLIKPNHHELGDLFGVKISTKKDVILYAKKLQEKGARNVLVSMAGEGAVLVTETGEEFEHNGLKGSVKNSVGAGDSMVAGFIAGYVRSSSFEEAFKLGIAAGSASAFSEDLATKQYIEELFEQL